MRPPGNPALARPQTLPQTGVPRAPGRRFGLPKRHQAPPQAGALGSKRVRGSAEFLAACTDTNPTGLPASSS